MTVCKNEKRSLFILAMTAALGAGCGGGQAGSSGPSSAVQTTNLGNAVISYSGQPKPQLSSSGGTVTVVGQAGAAFSSITLEPPHNLADTYIAFTRQLGASAALYTMPYGNWNPQILYQNPQGIDNVAISVYGTIALNAAALNVSTIRPDGTGFASLSFSGSSFAYAPQYSVDGTNRLCFRDLSGHLYTAPGTGGAATAIQSNTTNYSSAMGVWSPSGAQIAYTVGTTNGCDTYVSPSSGGSATDITPTALAGEGYLFPLAWSPDGTTILADYVALGSTTDQLVRFSTATTTAVPTFLTPTGDSDLWGGYSPDGSKIIFYRSSANNATPGLYTADSEGLNQVLAVADASINPSGQVERFAWSQFLPKETVVATSGSTFYHQPASGFLLSQNGSQFGSMVAFTATTPSSASIQAPTSTGQGAPLAFSLTADSITSIGYINNYFNPGTTVSLSGTSSAIVTIDASTGQVDLVAPAAEKATSKLNADGSVTYSGRFKAVYNNKGNNLAPAGASQLVVNPKSGKLVSFK